MAEGTFGAILPQPSCPTNAFGAILRRRVFEGHFCTVISLVRGFNLNKGLCWVKMFWFINIEATVHQFLQPNKAPYLGLNPFTFHDDDV